MQGFKQFSLFSAVSTAALLISTTAFAEGAEQPAGGDASATTGLQDIVVTARKREENIQTTPVAVSALAGGLIEQNRLVRIDDLQKNVPSLVVFPAGGLIGTPYISLRGITSSDFIPTNENPVAMYIDGVYVSRAQGALFGLNDLERVEVLRGPQGTLNGRNATAGSIALFTKAPAQDFSLSQKFSYGTYNDFVSATTMNTGEWGNTGLSARISFYHHKADGYIRNTLSADKSDWPGAINDNALFAAVRGHWGDLTIDYKLDYDKKSGQGPSYQIITMSPTYLNFLQANNPGVQFVQPKFSDVQTFIPQRKSRDTTEGHSLTAFLDLDPALQIKSITGFRRLHTFYQSNIAPTPPIVGNVSAFGGPVAVQPIELTDIRGVEIRQHQISQELQLLGKVSRLSYVVGLYYFRERASEFYSNGGSFSLSIPANTPTIGRFGATLFDFTNVADSKAAFGQASYTPPVFDDRIEITGGLRYTKDKKHLVQTLPLVNNPVIQVPRDVSRHDDNLSAEGSIKVQWEQNLMTYFRVAQAYKAGGISPRDTTFSATGYPAEKTISYELGVKAELFDRHLRVNADIYRSNFSNIQIVQNFTAAQGCASAVICSTTVAGGDATYDGVEAEITALPIRGLELSGSLGYIDPTWNKLRTTPTESSDVAKLPGTVFSYLSKWTLSGSAQYTFYSLPIGDLSFRGSVNYHSTRYFNNQVLPTNNNFAVRDPGFTNVGAQINLSNLMIGESKFAVSLYADNLLDRHQVLQGIDVGIYSSDSFGPGRTFGVSIKGDFK